MTFRIHEREIDGMLFDIHGTLYKRGSDEIFIPVQLELSRLLSRGENYSEEHISSKRQEYISLAGQIGSWRRAYIALGGNESEYFRVLKGINWPKKLERNKELIELIERLNSVAAVGIISGGLDSMSEPMCTQILGTDWRKLFQTIIFDDTPDLPARKPDPKSFLYALQLMKVEPLRAAMVGDSLGADLIPAAGLGMLTIYVGDQDGVGDLRISRIEDLLTVIDTTS